MKNYLFFSLLAQKVGFIKNLKKEISGFHSLTKCILSIFFLEFEGRPERFSSKFHLPYMRQGFSRIFNGFSIFNALPKELMIFLRRRENGDYVNLI